MLLEVVGPDARAQTLYVTSGSQSVLQVNSTGTATSFANLPSGSYPQGLAFDSNGTLYASDFFDNQIDTISPTGAVNVFATLPAGSGPAGLAFDSSGNLYVADANTNQISKIGPNGSVTPYASLTGNPGTVGLAFNASGTLFVSDYNTNQISEISPNGTVNVFATLPSGSLPRGLAFDSSGNLYAADFGNNHVSEISPPGSVSLFATLPIYGNAASRPGAGAEGLAFDKSGNLYVPDYFADVIDKVSPAKAVSTFTSAITGPKFLAFAPTTELLSVGVSWPAITQNGATSIGLDGGQAAKLVANAFQPFIGTKNETVVALSATDASNYASLQNAVSWMVNPNNSNHLVNGDTFVFYLGTHGSYEDVNTAPIAGHDPPIDAQYSPTDLTLRKSTTADGQVELGTINGQPVLPNDDDIASLFSGNAWTNIHKIFLMDSCFSGHFAYVTPYDLGGLPNSKVIASSSADDFSYWDGTTGLPHFASAIADTLTTAASQGEPVNFLGLLAGLGQYTPDSDLSYISDLQDQWATPIYGAPSLDPVYSENGNFDWTITAPEPAAFSVISLCVLFIRRTVRSRSGRSPARTRWGAGG
jgi:streptogramin lyase